MTPARAKKLAEQHGCTFALLDSELPPVWVISRTPDNWGLITEASLTDATEAAFVSFYIPDPTP